MDINISKKIEDLRIKSVNEFRDENYMISYQLLNEAWELLPENKIEEKESFIIVSYILEIGIRLQNREILEKWCDEIKIASPTRPDCGEREMWVGKVQFELGKYDLAKENFLVANKKSGGRCFKSKDLVYKQFFDRLD